MSWIVTPTVRVSKLFSEANSEGTGQMLYDPQSHVRVVELLHEAPSHMFYIAADQSEAVYSSEPLALSSEMLALSSCEF